MLLLLSKASCDIGGMYIDTRCKFENFNHSYWLLSQQLETRVGLLTKELTAALTEEKDLLDVAKSFIPTFSKSNNQQFDRRTMK